MREIWSSDTPVSTPEPLPPDTPIVVAFGGIGFTTGGLAHDVSESDIENLFTPFFSPEGFGNG